jgi:virginiamycin B lyase
MSNTCAHPLMAAREPIPSRLTNRLERRLAAALVFGSLAPLLLAASAPAAVKEFPISLPPFAITAGPHGDLWFTEHVPGNHRIGKITTAGAITYTRISGAPGTVFSGPNGDVWFDETTGLGRITPGGAMSEFPPAPAAGSGTSRTAITAGPEGNPWFAGTAQRCTFTGTPPPPPPPPPPPRPAAAGLTATAAIVTDYCGLALQIGKLTVAGPTLVSTMVYNGPEREHGVLAAAITTGPDGNLWFSERREGGSVNAIGKLTPAGVLTEYSLGNYNGAFDLTVGPDGNLWFTAPYPVPKIGKITPAGAITYYNLGKIPPLEIAAGPDRSLWFTVAPPRPGVPADRFLHHRIGRITTGGAVTYYSVGSGYVSDITAGPDGKLWFIEQNPNRIGNFSIKGGRKRGKKHH